MNTDVAQPPRTKQPRSAAQLLRKARDYQRIFGPLGVWLAVRTKFTQTQRTVPARLPGGRQRVNIRLNSSDLATFTKIFLDREYEVALAKKPKVIIDAGANVGYASAFFALKYPEAKIIAIEPEAGNFALLRQNTAGFSNISLVHGAIWPTSGQVNLLDPGMGAWGFEVADAAAEASLPSLGKVQAVTVEDLMNQFHLPYIDILKVDIEGGEKALFTGTPAWLKHVGVIMIELHDQRQPGCSLVFSEATRDFDREMQQGENTFKFRHEYITAPAS